MPFFSVIIPVYNNSEYLQECFDSLVEQDFEDWEAVVVVDGSPDDSASVAFSYRDKDDRFFILDEKENVGLHLARKKGVAVAQGEYSFFLDADDSLNPGALWHLFKCVSSDKTADVLHFGIEVIPEGETTDSQAAEFASFLNKEYGPLVGEEVLRRSFSPSFGFERDWRVTQRVYETSLLKRAFSRMTDDRLERAEDSYEYFVLASLEKREISDATAMPYRYYYGRGVTGFDSLPADRFLASARQFKDCYDHIIEYAQLMGPDELIDYARGAKAKLLDLLFNDWLVRVSQSEKMLAIDGLVKTVGRMETASQIMRIARDVAYEEWSSGIASEKYCFAKELYNIALDHMDFSSDDVLAIRGYRLFETAARNHIESIESRRKQYERCKNQDIRIFVSTHKEAAFFDSSILQPVQVGSRQAARRFYGLFHDDAGDNISDLNPMYCELTTQYWAWKNIEAEYYGFCHYRRYFDFSPIRHVENAYGEVMERYIDVESQKKYCLDDEFMEGLIRKYDVITTEIKDLRAFPGDVETPLAQYHAAPRLVDADLARVIEILKRMHPDYAHDADEFFNGSMSCFCNMFIMRKDIFFDYCEWLFPILEEFVACTDMSNYSKEALRTPGHLSERLFNIFYRHHLRVGSNWKTKQLQCVHFEHPEPIYGLVPPSDSGLMPIVPIVYAADGNYVPMLATTIHSMLANATPDCYYDIIVFERGVSSEDMRIMRQEYAVPGKVSLRFYNVGRIIESYDLATNNAHISIETYYRFLVQELLPYYDKVLYLDSDLIVQGDVSRLYMIELGDNLLAAVRDVDFLGNLNMKEGGRLEYAKDVLGMSDPYAYFQAGVLVLNTKALRELHSVEEWMSLGSDDRYIYNDQDILNSECEGRVLFLDYRWNVMTDCDGRVERVFSYAPNEVYEAFLSSRKDSLITHYAGYEKPWKMKRCDRSELYWKYARQTPFYERLVSMLCVYDDPDDRSWLPGPVMRKDSPIRKFVDPVMPLGSRRREVMKGIARRLKKGR